MKQKLIVESNAVAFNIAVNKLLDENWYYVPDTLKVTMSHDGTTERFVILLIQDDESDELIEAIKQQIGMEGNCNCPGESHDSHMPPPFFQSPDDEPHSEDGLTNGKE